MHRQELDIKHHLRGLELTLVKKEDLLQTVKDNRQRHEDNYRKALIVFRKETTDLFDDTTRKLRVAKVKVADEKTLVNSDLRTELQNAVSKIYTIVFPEEHLDDYDATIRKLEMSVDTEVELTDSEFNQYVMDNWEWKRSFALNTMSYSAKSI